MEIILILVFVGMAGYSATTLASVKSQPNWFYALDDKFKKYGAIHGVDWKLLKTIAMNESTLGQNERVKQGRVSYDNLSWGLMQFTLTTAQWLKPKSSIEDLKNDDYSIDLAGQFFAYLKKRFPESLNQERNIVMSYNHGEGNQKRFVELEKSGKLKETDYKAGREYWTKYQNNMKKVNGG